MYLDYFGLQEEPFSMTPNPRFLFWSHQHEVASESLLYGINQRKGFLLLTGEIGTGKTTLCREVMNRLDAKTELALVLNPMLSTPELLRSINDDFGIRLKKKAAAASSTEQLSLLSGAGLFGSANDEFGRKQKKESADDQLNLLRQFLLARAKDGHNAVVIIDEAQNLSVEALEMVRLLSNLETDSQKLLQIVLIGQPELEQTLRSHELRQLNQRIAIRQRLGTLSHKELTEYVFHRVQVAGGKGRINFKSNSLKMIHGYTNGFPRLINMLCDRILLAAYAKGTCTIDKDLVKEGINDLDGPGANRSWWRLW